MSSFTKFVVSGVLSVGIALGVSSVAKAEHKVVTGDTLSKIANQYGTSLDAVVQANPQLKNINLIYVGQTVHGVGNGTTVARTSAYVAPKSNYVTPKRNYVAPKKTYVAPKKTYVAPKKKYVAPKKQYVSNVSGSEASAKAWIAYKESTNNYNAVSATGKFIGKYQLTNTYLKGDHSPANQERVVSLYIKGKYGSWSNAKAHHVKFGWY